MRRVEGKLITSATLFLSFLSLSWLSSAARLGFSPLFPSFQQERKGEKLLCHTGLVG